MMEFSEWISTLPAQIFIVLGTMIFMGLIGIKGFLPVTLANIWSLVVWQDWRSTYNDNYTTGVEK